MGDGAVSGTHDDPGEDRIGQITQLPQRNGEQAVELTAAAAPAPGHHLVIQILRLQGQNSGRFPEVQRFKGHRLQMPPDQPGQIACAAFPSAVITDPIQIAFHIPYLPVSFFHIIAERPTFHKLR